MYLHCFKNHNVQSSGVFSEIIAHSFSSDQSKHYLKMETDTICRPGTMTRPSNLGSSENPHTATKQNNER